MTTASAPSRSRSAAQASPGNLAQVGADRAQAAGFTGSGVTVAVLDTGIDATHPDLAGRVVAQENFSVSPDTVDRVGHGTHVASIVAGERSGVAPGTGLLVGKVLDDTGFGNESDVIAGMEWAAPQADVVNMSLGAPFASDGSDPLSLAVDALSDQYETLFVIAAGNSGPASATIELPGTSDRALTVGAVDGSDTVADFSSRGPLTGSFELKPEVVAPGVDIVAARAAGTSLGDPVDGLFTSVSGTSMATPHVAGAAADLVQQHPDWTAAQLKDALVGSADPIGGDGFDVGAGRLDIGDALDATVRPERDVADVVLADPRTSPHAETFSWTNTGSVPETLDLSVSLEDRHGSPVDAVSVSPASLALAPGATGSATVTIDGPALGAGLYTGTVTADPEGPAGEPDDLRTPIGLHATPPTVNLTLEATPPRDSGSTDAQALVAITNLDDFAEFVQLWFVSGSLSL
jgi:subtilisin family serine protease